ncbi:hypothetical protein IWX90DRAFT_303807 [Phyllosticta citrichinensis]|uniref:Uncharacterized protein n=1 Tax=Phyllosticta citrichinensis TaxID=1130410 RepID=A0ABR1XLN1_9PEZI
MQTKQGGRDVPADPVAHEKACMYHASSPDVVGMAKACLERCAMSMICLGAVEGLGVGVYSVKGFGGLGVVFCDFGGFCSSLVLLVSLVIFCCLVSGFPALGFRVHRPAPSRSSISSTSAAQGGFPSDAKIIQAFIMTLSHSSSMNSQL